jgi:hypothetical protein
MLSRPRARAACLPVAPYPGASGLFVSVAAGPLASALSGSGWGDRSGPFATLHSEGPVGETNDTNQRNERSCTQGGDHAGTFSRGRDRLHRQGQVQTRPGHRISDRCRGGAHRPGPRRPPCSKPVQGPVSRSLSPISCGRYCRSGRRYTTTGPASSEGLWPWGPAQGQPPQRRRGLLLPGCGCRPGGPETRRTKSPAVGPQDGLAIRPGGLANPSCEKRSLDLARGRGQRIRRSAPPLFERRPGGAPGVAARREMEESGRAVGGQLPAPAAARRLRARNY